MTAIISRAEIIGGHDGRAEIEVELTYANGGKATLSLDEEACTASLDRACVHSIEELVGKPWSVVLPAIEHHQKQQPHTQQLQPLENHA